MSTDSLATCYRILELPPDADAVALRRHYRTLAQRLHPDRPGGSRDAFQKLQDAYATLHRFQRENGHLPFQQPVDKAPLLQPGQGIRRQPVHRKPFWKRLHFWLSGATMAGLLLFWWPHAPPPAVPAPAPGPVRTIPVAELPTFSLGASLADVIDIQGVPEKRHDDTWYYGSSRIYFSQGRVIGWYEDPAFPLHLAPGHPVSHLPGTPE